MIRTGSLLFFSLLLFACASKDVINQQVENNPTITQALEAKLTGVKLRWGGKLIRIDNEKDKSIIEIIDKPLARYGRPIESDNSEGRFLAQTSTFIDPENAKPGRYITVVGTLSGYTKKKIGEFIYTYPIVDIQTYRIWPKQRVYHDNYYYPYYHHYDPFWGPHPFYRHHLRHR